MDAGRIASARTVAQVNSTVLLDLLRAEGALARPELVRRSGLSSTTVNRLLDRLVDEGRVLESGIASSTGGRPARVVRFNASARSIVAVDVFGMKISAAVTDLEGAIQNRTEHVLEPGVGVDGRSYFDAVVDLASAMSRYASMRNAPVEAVGVSVPGVVRADSRVIEFAPAVQWFDFPLVPLLEEKLGIPVYIENAVNLLALAEHRHGVAQGVADVLTVTVGTGVGAALILRGDLYRGSIGAAGEIGYTLVDRRSLDNPWPGFGDLESRLGGAGVLSGWQHATPWGGPEQFLENYAAGEPAALQAFDDIVDHLAMAVGNASLLINPSLVVVGGEFGRAAGSFLIPAIAKRLTGRIPVQPSFAVATLAEAQLIGAAEFAIEGTRDVMSVSLRQ